MTGPARPPRPPVGGRRTARERALGLLYEAELKGVAPAQIVDEQPVRPDTFAVDVALGVGEHRPELDEVIGRFAKGWTIGRMPAVDRTVLRMGTYELTHRPDVPTAAILAEAVELAKRFSTEDSGRFVNGLLARIALECRGDAGPRSTHDVRSSPARDRSRPLRDPSELGVVERVLDDDAAADDHDGFLDDFGFDTPE